MQSTRAVRFLQGDKSTRLLQRTRPRDERRHRDVGSVLLDRFGACFPYPSAFAKLQIVASIADFALGTLQELAIDNHNRKSALAAFFTGATIVNSIMSNSLKTPSSKVNVKVEALSVRLWERL